MLSLKYLIVSLSDAYSMIIFVYVMLSWLPTDRGILADINNVLARICDPYLNLFKRLIPPIGGMVDVTPIVALLVLQFGVRLLVNLFYGAHLRIPAHQMKGYKDGYHLC